MDAFLPFSLPVQPIEDLKMRARKEVEFLRSRRSVRRFSKEQVPKEVIENLILCAGLAPSGANQQPWTFCAISSPDLKKKNSRGCRRRRRICFLQRQSYGGVVERFETLGHRANLFWRMLHG